MDRLIRSLIEINNESLLVKILDSYSGLYQHHSNPLSFVYDLLYHYCDAPVLEVPLIRKKIVKLLGDCNSNALITLLTIL
jgi:hypothetical protein